MRDFCVSGKFSIALCVVLASTYGSMAQDRPPTFAGPDSMPGQGPQTPFSMPPDHSRYAASGQSSLFRNVPARPRGNDDHAHETPEPADLTLDNLLTAGWDTEFQRRPTSGRAVRLPLFRTRQPFLFREIRFDYRYAANAESGRADQHILAGELLLAVNRRFQFGVFPEYEWLQEDDGRLRHAAFWAFANRLQLIDTHDSALNVAYRVRTPRGETFDDGLTRIGMTLAGFRDLGNRVGIQGHVETDFFIGPRQPGQSRYDMTYALAVTKTVTEEDVFPADLTFFVEGFGRTHLEGRNAGRTSVSLLPGCRFMVVKDLFFAAGVEIPVVAPRPFDQTFHFSIRREF